jgi:hypothetical protein
MTSDGSATVRLQRALANERCSAAQIRALVAELAGPVGLEDALTILLALLDREPTTFSRAAARWGSRLVLEHKLTLDDAQLTLAALEVLPSARRRRGADRTLRPLRAAALRRAPRRVDAPPRARELARPRSGQTVWR